MIDAITSSETTIMIALEAMKTEQVDTIETLETVDIIIGWVLVESTKLFGFSKISSIFKLISQDQRRGGYRSGASN